MGYPVRVWAFFLSHTRTGIPYAYGHPVWVYAYGMSHTRMGKIRIRDRTSQRLGITSCMEEKRSRHEPGWYLNFVKGKVHKNTTNFSACTALSEWVCKHLYCRYTSLTKEPFRIRRLQDVNGPAPCNQYLDHPVYPSPKVTAVEPAGLYDIVYMIEFCCRIILPLASPLAIYANVSSYSCTHGIPSLSMFMICLSSMCVQQCVHACNQCLLLSCLWYNNNNNKALWHQRSVAMHVAVVQAANCKIMLSKVSSYMY